MKKILFVEDNLSIVDGIKYLLEKENLNVFVTTTIKHTIEQLNDNTYDLILLDVILPDGNGVDFYNKFKPNIPVIFFTAKGSEEDVIRGLELGAEDYIIKSFRTRELIFRIKKVLKRNEDNSIINIQNLQFNKNNNIVYRNGKEIYLTALEHRLLSILIENRGKIVSRQYLLSQIWDCSNNFVNDNTLTVYMKRIREKIEDDVNNPKLVKTVRGGRL